MQSKFLKLVSFISIFTFVSPVMGQTIPSDPSLPTFSERLSQEIPLSCAGLSIVEWRASQHYDSSISQQGIDTLNKLCHRAFEKYPDFLKSKGYRFDQNPINTKLALMPANIDLEGKQSRNLNDVTGRFAAAGPACCYWGLYVPTNKYLFLRNDPVLTINHQYYINKYFQRTFLHEMAHVFNDQWNVKRYNFPTDESRDEALAEEWVKWLGIKFETESSDEDLRHKHIHAN